MKSVSVIPTLVTAANGYCGLLALYKTQDGRYYEAASFILWAMLFDFLDGKVARMAGTTSRFGAYLDSLSDAISFGAAPAVLAKAVVETHSSVYGPKLLAILTIPFALFAIMRLARYNVEHASGEGSDRQGKGVDWFAGIPTPGAAGVVAGLVFLRFDPAARFPYDFVLVALPPLCLALGALMISRIPYAHFGKIFFQGRRDFRYLFFLIVGAGLAVKFTEEVAAIAFFAYMLSGPVLAPWRLKRIRDEELLAGEPDAEGIAGRGEDA